MNQARGKRVVATKKRSTSEDVDWKGILSAASMFGNAIQAWDRAEMKGRLDDSKRELAHVFLEKEKFKTALRQLQLAHEKMKKEFALLEQALDEKEAELSRLKSRAKSAAGE